MTAPPVIGRHVLIVTRAGAFTAAGKKLSEPVDSAAKLGKLILWAAHPKRGGLQPFPGTGEELLPARVWLLGDAVELLAASNADSDGGSLGQALAPLVDDGWELRGGAGSAVVLAHGHDPNRVVVEVLAEEQPWLAGGDETIAADAAELGRRLSRWYEALGVLPGTDGVNSGAALLDSIMAGRIASGHGAVVSAAGVLPAWATPESRIQPAWCATPEQAEREFERCDELVLLTQESPALGSAGMLTFGYGTPAPIEGEHAAKAAALEKRPFGCWLAELPAGAELASPQGLPLPHPQMAQDHRVQAWLTGEDLEGMTTDIRAGGAGLTLEKLAISEAVIWPQQARVLDGWTKRVRDALKDLADDVALRQLVQAMADEYLSALADPESEDNHFQPVWAASIAAHIRYRGRRGAMRISREYHAWPIYAEGASMLYAPARAEDPENPVDLSDTHTRLGRLVTTARVELTEQTVLAVILAESSRDVAAALTSAVGLTAPIAGEVAVTAGPAPELDAPCADAVVVDEESVETEPDSTAAATVDVPSAEPVNESGVMNPAPAPVPLAETAEIPPAAGPAAVPNRAARRRAPKKVQDIAGPQFPAAVLHTDGLWLPDGTRIDVPDTVVHVGHVAELAYAHNVEYFLTPNYSEQGQIWITADACASFGIDAEALGLKKHEALQEMTKDLEFVTAAIADGWMLGGQKDNQDGDQKKAPSLGAWTRIYREDGDRHGVWVALVPGMVRGRREKDVQLEMPVLAGDPSPATVARRLKIFADAHGFPWKVSAGTTAIDLMMQSFPKNKKPQEWREEFFSPSTTPIPAGILDVNVDFNWSRLPTAEELEMRYCHAYDRGGSYPAVLPGLYLGIGDPVHLTEDVTFDPKLPGYWLIKVPNAGDTRMPYILNPGRTREFEYPKWVCSPAVEQAINQGYEIEVLEAIVWPERRKVLEKFYDRIHHAADLLDTAEPDHQAARNQSKVMRNGGMGMLASVTYMKGRYGFKPEWWFSIVSKANFNIMHNIVLIGKTTGRWPLAVLKDTVIYASDDPDPQSAWPGASDKYGRRFGQYKHEGSALMSEHAQYLTGKGYDGKEHLVDANDWVWDAA
ncbi:hypothetical protein [Mycobacterium intracellulare]|uniref:hypothetical protein n=1 Tax=Mycobacterium intracellulare TaxID=1767 RepID=UPI001EEDDBDF|nr:hypothetical protein [Mycobacterium intracellulare]MEE3755225.1 hypothetical protein [Mycobacterium intracellulare]